MSKLAVKLENASVKQILLVYFVDELDDSSPSTILESLVVSIKKRLRYASSLFTFMYVLA